VRYGPPAPGPPPGRGRLTGAGPRPPAPGGGGMGRPVRDRGGPGGGGILRPLGESGGPPGRRWPGGGTGPRAAGRGASMGGAGTSVGRDGGAMRGSAGAAGACSGGRVGRGRSVDFVEITRPGIGAGGVGVGASPEGASDAAAGATGSAGAGAGSGVACSWGAGSASAGAVVAAGAGAASASAGSAAFFFAGLLRAGFASSGCWSRMSPSRSAFRRTRSACASMMLEECVFTPMPSDRHRSRHSLFVKPSSLASSWTRSFAAKFRSQPFLLVVRPPAASVILPRPGNPARTRTLHLRSLRRSPAVAGPGSGRPS